MLAHGVSVDIETDGLGDGVSERLDVVAKVEHGEDGSASDEGTLLGVSNVDDVDVVVGVDLELGVDVVPLGGRGKVDLDFGGGTVDGVLDARVADLGADQDILTERDWSTVI